MTFKKYLLLLPVSYTHLHQPMLAYWNGQFYYQYLADPSDEHVPPSQTFLMTSKDGYQWTNPEIVFPRCV